MNHWNNEWSQALAYLGENTKKREEGRQRRKGIGEEKIRNPRERERERKVVKVCRISGCDVEPLQQQLR